MCLIVGDQAATAAIEAKNAAASALEEARREEAKAMAQQQELRESIRTKSMSYGGLGGYGFPAVQGYNESLRPLIRLHGIDLAGAAKHSDL